MFQAFENSVGELQESDLSALITPEPKYEGLFLEYKRDWPNQGVARSVASFANSVEGGWLIIGVEARDLEPVAVVGIAGSGELETRVSNVVRASLSPIPQFASQTVSLADGNRCVVVRVPPGYQPPYVHVPSGRIYVRTAVSSEPVNIEDRETLDRLYNFGRRGRDWAVAAGQEFLRERSGDHAMSLATFPYVAGGLNSATVLRWSVVERVIKASKHPMDPSPPEDDPDGKLLSGPDWFRFATATFRDVALVTRVAVDGSVIVQQSGAGAGNDALKRLAQQRLPLVRTIYEEFFDFRGSVSLAAAGTWQVGETEGSKTANMLLRDLEVATLDSEQLVQRIGRGADRAAGYFAWEPDD